MNFYKRFPGDYIRDTMQLSMLQDGAYNRLIDWCYSNELHLPHSLPTIYRIARASSAAEKRAVQTVLAQFFEKTTEGYSQGRVREAIADHAERVKLNTDLGRRGGRPVTETVMQTVNGSVSDSVIKTITETEPNSNPSHQPQAINRTKATSTTRAAVPPPPLPDWLDAGLWKAFRDHRRSKRSGMTPHAEKLLIAKLGDLRAAGDDPRQVIERSIERGWSGLFAVRAEAVTRTVNGNGSHAPPTNRRDIRADNIAELTGRTKRERTIEGTAERVGGTSVPTLPSDLRKPGRDNVG